MKYFPCTFKCYSGRRILNYKIKKTFKKFNKKPKRPKPEVNTQLRMVWIFATFWRKNPIAKIAKKNISVQRSSYTNRGKSKQIWEYLMKNDPLITVWSRVCTCACRSWVKNDRNGTCEHAKACQAENEGGGDVKSYQLLVHPYDFFFPEADTYTSFLFGNLLFLTKH